MKGYKAIEYCFVYVHLSGPGKPEFLPLLKYGVRGDKCLA